MKVKLITKDADKIVNYQNVHINQLDSIYDNGCFEILCDHNVLKMVSPDQIEQLIQVLCSKLRHGGELIISGLDIDVATKQYQRKDFDISVFSKLLSSSLGFYNCRIIEEYIRTNGLDITSMSIQDSYFVVKGKRD